MADSRSGEEKYFVFQGNSLAVPPEPGGDEPFSAEICREKITEALGNVWEDHAAGICAKASDFFEVPSLEDESGPPIRALALSDEARLPQGWEFLPVRRALDLISGGAMAQGKRETGRLLRACHINIWRGESVFCGKCGSRNKDAESGEVARQCPVCGRLEFPRISPAVITVITNNRGEALLAHNRKFAPGLYSLIAGFNEAGEDLEQTVAREIREEVGIEVKDIRYIRSQPWPFPNSLMTGFSASYKSGEIRPDGSEIEDAKWFTREELPQLPGSGSISRYLIGLWLDGKL